MYKHGTNLEQIGTIQRTNWNDTENIVERFPDNGVNNETCFIRSFLTITTYTSTIKSHCFNQEKEIKKIYCKEKHMFIKMQNGQMTVLKITIKKCIY